MSTGACQVMPNHIVVRKAQTKAGMVSRTSTVSLSSARASVDDPIRMPDEQPADETDEQSEREALQSDREVLEELSSARCHRAIHQ